MAGKKNLTIRLMPETIRRAKTLAARQGISVSSLVARYLEQTAGQDHAYQAARRDALKALSKVFVDTNVLVYAHDRDAGQKREFAAARLAELWETRLGVLSTQVLEEFYVTTTRKIPKPISRAAARDILRSYTVWQVEPLAPDLVFSASEIEERYQLSFRDALIVGAARQGGAARIWSEDLPAGQTIAGLIIENPWERGPSRAGT